MNVLKTTEIVHFKWWIVWYMIYTSVKLGHKSFVTGGGNQLKLTQGKKKELMAHVIEKPHLGGADWIPASINSMEP